MERVFILTAEALDDLRSLFSRQSSRAVQFSFWLGTAVLLLMFSLSLTSLTQKSPTFDEQCFILRGLAYLREENRDIRVGHPLGLNALNALFLVGDDTIQLPVDDPSWQKTSFHRPAEIFLWETGNDVSKVMFLARLPSVWLGLLLAALTGRWARALTRCCWAELLALALMALDPNVLAHMRLATTDLGLTLAALLAGFLLWWFLKRPSWGAAAWAGAAFGLLQNTKFTAGLFVPLFAGVILVGLGVAWRRDGRFPTQMLLQLVIAYPVAAFLTLWATYGFQVGPLPQNLPVFPQLAGLTLPLSHHLEQLLDIGGRIQKGTPAFLLGQSSDSGWWYYFPIAFLLKTPLPTLILLCWAFLRLAWGQWRLRQRQGAVVDLAALLIPALGFFAIALTTDINLGYRHILPILPFLIIFIAASAGVIHNLQLTTHKSQLLVPLFLLWLAAISLWLHPHYLAYFNALAGGPDGGWRALVDSNLDWGQDLVGLKGWMDENDVERVWLSYFGEGRPEYYGIAYDGLDSFPPRLMNPQARPFTPTNPAPGVYAISATNLQGVHFTDHDQFAWFRQQKPIAKIGYSIFLYRVPADGPPVDLLLSGVQLDEIVPVDLSLWQTNDVRPRWFDAAQSWLQPGTGQGWLILAENTAVPSVFSGMLEAFRPVAAVGSYQIYQNLEAATSVPVQAWFRQGEGKIGFVAAMVDEATAVPGASLTLVTRWQKQSPPQPVKMFIHLIDPENTLVSQWDGLGAAWEGWQANDTLWQLSTLPLPPDLPPGDYQLWAGFYHPATGERWRTEVADRILLSVIRVREREEK